VLFYNHKPLKIIKIMAQPTTTKNRNIRNDEPKLIIYYGERYFDSVKKQWVEPAQQHITPSPDFNGDWKELAQSVSWGNYSNYKIV